jgi:hypothetical protein
MRMVESLQPAEQLPAGASVLWGWSGDHVRRPACAQAGELGGSAGMCCQYSQQATRCIHPASRATSSCCRPRQHHSVLELDLSDFCDTVLSSPLTPLPSLPF